MLNIFPTSAGAGAAAVGAAAAPAAVGAAPAVGGCLRAPAFCPAAAASSPPAPAIFKCNYCWSCCYLLQDKLLSCTLGGFYTYTYTQHSTVQYMYRVQ